MREPRHYTRYHPGGPRGIRRGGRGPALLARRRRIGARGARTVGHPVRRTGHCGGDRALLSIDALPLAFDLRHRARGGRVAEQRRWPNTASCRRSEAASVVHLLSVAMHSERGHRGAARPAQVGGPVHDHALDQCVLSLDGARRTPATTARPRFARSAKRRCCTTSERLGSHSEVLNKKGKLTDVGVGADPDAHGRGCTILLASGPGHGTRGHCGLRAPPPLRRQGISAAHVRKGDTRGQPSRSGVRRLRRAAHTPPLPGRLAGDSTLTVPAGRRRVHTSIRSTSSAFLRMIGSGSPAWCSSNPEPKARRRYAQRPASQPDSRATFCSLAVSTRNERRSPSPGRMDQAAGRQGVSGGWQG